MPNLDLLDALLNHRLLTSANPAHWWTVKVRAKRLLSVSRDPDALAARMLTILQRVPRQGQQIAA